MADNEEEIDFWDKDHTLLNTERRWFQDALVMIAKAARQDAEFVQVKFDEVNARTFAFAALFRAVGIEEWRYDGLERLLRADLARSIESHLYPGIVDVLRRRKARGIRQVLITAGDPTFQSWKFEKLACLHDIFDPADRHFVALTGSKGERIANYRSVGRKNFNDDSARWQREAGAWDIPGLRRNRVQWPDTTGTGPADGDDVEWAVTRSAEEIEAWLESA